VSVPSVGYDLSRVTAPDPAQVIQIFSQEPEGAGTATPQPEGLKVGDTFPLRTGVILDHNGHPVPDGTVVRFMLVYQGDDLPAVREATTSGGVASTEITLNRTGVLEITAMSEPALNSFRLQLNVQPDAVIYITVIAPTATDTPTPEPVTPTPEPPSTATPTPPATPTGGNPPDVVGRVSGRDFVMMCLGLMGALVVGYRFGSTNAHRQHRVRVALSGAIGVLAGYNWFALGLPGADLARQLLGVWAASACVLAGAVVGLAAGWYGFSRQAPPHA
jgi:beta-N-acetylhexosaminidase